MENTLKTKKHATNETKEKCIVCRAETPYNFNTPIAERKYYIEGSGQLCENCYYSIYIKK